MEDLLNEAAPPEPKVKVIAIKLPFDLQERFHTFPFIHAIRELYPKADIHFITPKRRIEILNLLPFEAYYHEFNEDEIKTVFDVHRYCAFAKIFNVDLFISLTNSFPDACLGIGLRAKQRLGFSDGWKTLVLNQKCPRPVGHHPTEAFYELYKVHTGKDIDPRMKVVSRELPYVVSDYDTSPYIAVNLSPIRNMRIDPAWKEFVEYFENQRFIFFAAEDQKLIAGQVEAWMASLPARNFYAFFPTKDWIDLSKLITYSRGCLTYEGPAASLSAYVGTKTLILYEREDAKVTAPFYFLSDINIMDVKEPAVGNSGGGTVLKNRDTFKMDKVFERAGEFFKI
jgi:ADP-heptose:LPS heptosyltransferase